MRFRMHQRVPIVAIDRGANVLVETLGPIEWSRIRIHHLQVVDDVAAAQHQHAVVAQGRECRADGPVEICCARRIQRELQNRNLGVGIHVHQHGPRAVIEPPRIVERNVERAQHLGEPAGELRIAGRVVANGVEVPWKPVEIVNGPGPLADRHRDAAYVPVRRDDENCTGSGSSAPSALHASE